MELGGAEVSEAVGTKGLSGVKEKKGGKSHFSVVVFSFSFSFFLFFFFFFGLFSFFSLSFPLIPSHLLCCFQKDQMAAFAFPATIERTEVGLHSAEQHLVGCLFLCFFLFFFLFCVCFVLFVVATIVSQVLAVRF